MEDTKNIYPVKDFVGSYTYSTIGKRHKIIRMRKFRWHGQEAVCSQVMQDVTLCGYKYRYGNEDGTCTYRLFVGVTRRNPNDAPMKKSKAFAMAEEIAASRANGRDPYAVITVTRGFSQDDFDALAKTLLNTMRLSYDRK
jgi:hypothetical protein